LPPKITLPNARPEMNEQGPIDPGVSFKAGIFARMALLLGFLLPLLVAAVYWPGLGGGFAFDDFPNIVDNKTLHVSQLNWPEWLAAMFSSPSSQLQRPLAMLSFAINHYFTGLDPWPMKLTNVAIHALNSLLVLALVRRLVGAAQLHREDGSRKDWVALFASACWALHPINLMAVLFVVQRMEILSHSFVFFGLWLYVTGRQRQQAGLRGWGRILAGLIPCTILGLLAKESAALIPLYAFCLELCLFRFLGNDQVRDRRLYVMYAVVLFLPAIMGVAWLLPNALAPGAYAARDFTLSERLWTEPRVVLDYLHWIVAPDLGTLALFHDDYVMSRGPWSPASTVFAAVSIPILLALAWIARAKRPLLSLGLLWFFGAQLITATFIPLELVFEHRNYFASIGICLVFADLLMLMPERKNHRLIGACCAAALLLLYAGITHLRAREWDHPVRFSISEATKHPQSPRATYDLARTLIVLGNYRPDSPYTRQAWPALERARQASGGGVLPTQAALMLAARTDAQIQPAWWQDMSRELSRPIGPRERAAVGALAKCAVEGLCKFPVQDMLGIFGAALSQGPDPEILSMYGDYALNVLDEPELALSLWQEASAQNPREPQHRINLAKLLIALGRYDEARLQIARLRELGRLGQNTAAAESLERRLRGAESASVK
jgi:tetratricopeptide (TPR) repeat protein